jgi:hypothetical protein
MRVGVGWFRFVHVEFHANLPSTCPPQRLFSSEETLTDRSLTREFDHQMQMRKFFPAPVGALRVKFLLTL